MDPITGAIIVAVAKLSEDAVRDAYEGLKSLIKKKFGDDSGIAKSVEELEAEPSSKGRKVVLEEQVTAAGADKDTTLVQAAKAIEDALARLGPGANVAHQVAGDNANQFGQVSGGSINITHGNS